MFTPHTYIPHSHLPRNYAISDAFFWAQASCPEGNITTSVEGTQRDETTPGQLCDRRQIALLLGHVFPS